MTTTQQQKEYIKEMIESSRNKAHRTYQIRCGNCGKIMIRYIIYYYSEHVDVNLHSLINYKCPNCGKEFKEEIEL